MSRYTPYADIQLPLRRSVPDTRPCPLPPLAHVIPADILRLSLKRPQRFSPPWIAPGIRPSEFKFTPTTDIPRAPTLPLWQMTRPNQSATENVPRASTMPVIVSSTSLHELTRSTGVAPASEPSSAPTTSPSTADNGRRSEENVAAVRDTASVEGKGREYVCCRRSDCGKEITKKFRADHEKLHKFEGERVRCLSDDLRCATCVAKKRQCDVAVNPRDADINTLRCRLCIQNRETCSFVRKWSLDSVEKNGLHPALP